MSFRLTDDEFGWLSSYAIDKGVTEGQAARELLDQMRRLHEGAAQEKS